MTNYILDIIIVGNNDEKKNGKLQQNNYSIMQLTILRYYVFNVM